MKSRVSATSSQKSVSPSQKALLSSVISCLAIVGSQSAFAQVLEEVLVTAQKRTESLQDVPIAVSAFSGDQFQSGAILSGGDLQKVVPNVSFVGDTGFGGYNFQIRGIGGQIQGAVADTGVGVHINNAPVTVNRFTQTEFYDVERVEVLRGPQGTLYGRNATGGVINILTAKPEDEFSAKLALDYGNYDAKRVTGHVNIPVSDTLAIRAAGFMLDRDGTHDNTETNNDVESKDIWSGRISVAWQPTDAINVDFMWEHFDQNDSTGGFRKLICATDPGPTSVGGVSTDSYTQLVLSESCLPTKVDDPRNTGHILTGASLEGIFGTLGGLQSLNALAGREPYSSDPYTISSTLDPFTIAENDQVSLGLTIDIGDDLTFTSLSAYSKDDNRASWTGGQAPGANTERFAATPFNPTGVVVDPLLGDYDFGVNRVFLDQDAEQFSQEFRLQSDYDGALNFNVGAIYIDLERLDGVSITNNSFTHFSNVLNATAFAGGPQIALEENSFPDGTGHNYLYFLTDYELKSTALFGEAYYQINDDIKATLGLRYTRDDKTVVNAPLGFFTPGSGVPEGVPQQETFSETTGRFTIDWGVTDDTMLYASYSRGYKGGGFNPQSAVEGIPETYDPELVDVIELGTKSSILDGRGTLNVTGFYYDYKDYQIVRIQNNSSINENVDAEVYGLELESVFAVTPELLVNANLGYLNTAVSDGVTSLDVYDRTQGDTNLTPLNDFSGAAPGGGCVVPTAEVVGLLTAIDAGAVPSNVLGLQCVISPNAFSGVPADVGGNELPTSPELTFALGAQYDVSLTSDWDVSMRADYSYRSSSYARIFNSVIDEVDSLDNLDLSLRFINDTRGFEVQLYARNLLSEDAIAVNQPLGETPGSYRVVSGKPPAFYGLRLTKSW